jgi:hypothetical protein
MADILFVGKKLIDLSEDCDAVLDQEQKVVAKHEIEKVRLEYAKSVFNQSDIDTNQLLEKIIKIKQQFQI